MKRSPAAKKRKSSRSKLLFKRRKFCKFCDDKVSWIDYREPRLLNNYIPERAKIQPRRTSGTCATHQRQLRQAIQRARNIALLPFTME
ncbi:MAG: 30S ribosomal protein S18 [Acidobacteriota bacterium]